MTDSEESQRRTINNDSDIFLSKFKKDRVEGNPDDPLSHGLFFWIYSDPTLLCRFFI